MSELADELRRTLERVLARVHTATTQLGEMVLHRTQQPGEDNVFFACVAEIWADLATVCVDYEADMGPATADSGEGDE